jgi:hypothetical protein
VLPAQGQEISWRATPGAALRIVRSRFSEAQRDRRFIIGPDRGIAQPLARGTGESPSRSKADHTEEFDLAQRRNGLDD